MSIQVPTQTLALLTKGTISLEDVEQHLSANGIKCHLEDAVRPSGVMKSFARSTLSDDGSMVLIESCAFPWSELAGSDALAANGDFSQESLERACQFQMSWEGVEGAIAEHHAIVLVSIVEEAGKTLSPVSQLRRLVDLSKTVLAIGHHPEVTAYFCPAGEVLLPVAMLAELLQTSQIAEVPPLDLFSNLRLSWLDERWVIFETIGNSQLLLPDFEIYADSQQHDLNELASWLRRLSWRQLTPENALADSHAIQNPQGADFDVVYAEDALLSPSRNVVRLIARDELAMPNGLPKRLRIERN